MNEYTVEESGHHHVFLGADHARSERRTRWAIGLCGLMMAVEIIGGLWFGSIALVADGLHMSTHAGALLLAVLAYAYARKYSDDPRFTFGTGKLGDLAGFSSAIILVLIALLIGYESLQRLLTPVPIRFSEAIPIAIAGLGVNLLSAWLLRAGGHDHHHHSGEHGDIPRDPPARAHAHTHAQAHRDHNLRAAMVHVIADATVSLLVIVGLLLARQFGWLWMDPLAGMIGAAVIASWSYALIRDTGAVLLDVNPDRALADELRKTVEREGDRLTDLHLWRVGPGHLAAILSVASPQPKSPAHYRSRLARFEALSHLTVEISPVAR